MDGPESPASPENPNIPNRNLDEYQTFIQKPDEDGYQHVFGVDENGGEHEVSYEDVAGAYGHDTRPADDPYLKWGNLLDEAKTKYFDNLHQTFGDEAMDQENENLGDEQSRRQQAQERFVDWFTDKRSQVGDKAVDARFRLGDKQADWVSERRLSRAGTITKQLHENYLHGEKGLGKASSPEVLAGYAIEQMLHETQAEPAKRTLEDWRHGVQPVGEPDQIEMSAERRLANRLAPGGHRLKNRLEAARSDALEGVLKELGAENIDLERWGNQINPAVVRDFRKFWIELRQAEGLTHEAAAHHITTGGLATVYQTRKDFEDYFDVDFDDYKKRGNEVIPDDVYRFVNTLLRLPDHQLDALAEVAGSPADNPYEWKDKHTHDEYFKQMAEEAQARLAMAVETERRERRPHTPTGDVLEPEDMEKAEDDEKDSWDVALSYIAGQHRTKKNRGTPFGSMSIESLTKFFERNGLSEEEAKRTYVDLQDEGIIDTQHTSGQGFRVNQAILEDHLSSSDGKETADKDSEPTKKEGTDDRPEKRAEQIRQTDEEEAREQEQIEREEEIENREEEERRKNRPDDEE